LLTDFSRLLPHRGGLTPLFAHQLPQYLPVREHDPTVPRMNGAAIDKRALKG
jgi:hypothetical protein